MTDEIMGWLISTILAVFAAAMLIRGVVWSWQGTVAALAAAAAAAAALGAAWVASRVGSRRVLQGAMTARVDTHGATGPASRMQRMIGRHELGHVVAAESTGMGVASVEIGDGHGYVQAERFTTVDDAITFLAAGHSAVHTKRGAGRDLAQIRALAGEIPRPQRAARVRAAVVAARRVTAAQSGRIRRDGDRLADTGRWV